MAKRKRRAYTNEFKAETVRLIRKNVPIRGGSTGITS